jgi:hypothetical protein
MALSANKGTQVDISGLMAHIADFSKLLGKDQAVVIKRQAALFCEDMLKYSRPFDGKTPGGGLLDGAQQHGMENVNNSIVHIFRPLAYATGEQVAAIGRYDVFKTYQEGKNAIVITKTRWSVFQRKYDKGGKALPFIPEGDLSAMRALHTSLRVDGGRGGLKQSVWESKEPFAIVESDKDMKTLILEKQKDVGKLKSPYWYAAQQLDEKIKGKKWVQNSEGRNDAIAERKESDPLLPEFTVGNRIGGKAGNDNFVKLAINHRAFAMRSAMVYEMKKQKLTLWGRSAATLNTSQYFTLA